MNQRFLTLTQTPVPMTIVPLFLFRKIYPNRSTLYSHYLGGSPLWRIFILLSHGPSSIYLPSHKPKQWVGLVLFLQILAQNTLASTPVVRAQIQTYKPWCKLQRYKAMVSLYVREQNNCMYLSSQRLKFNMLLAKGTSHSQCMLL